MILKGKVAPQLKYGNQYVGGAEQIYVNNLEDLINVE